MASETISWFWFLLVQWIRIIAFHFSLYLPELPESMQVFTLEKEENFVRTF